MKYNEARGGEPLILLSGNYLVAAGIGFGFVVFDESYAVSFETILFGAVLGFLFVFSFFSFAKAVNLAGTALATVSSRLSVVVPLLLSIIFFSEKPSIVQILGFIFTILTVFLFYHSLNTKKDRELELKDYFYLLTVLIGIGVSDFCMKVFQNWRPQTEKSLFIFIIFFSSFLYTLVVLYWKRIPIQRAVFLRGAMLGIPNVFSTVFLLIALSQLRAIIVYPTTNIGIILLTTFGAALIWKEKLNSVGIIALLTGIMAIILLGL